MVMEWDRVMEGSKLESQCGPKKKKTFTVKKNKSLLNKKDYQNKDLQYLY